MITSWKMCLALYDNLLTKTKADLIDFPHFLVVNYLICPNLRTFFLWKENFWHFGLFHSNAIFEINLQNREIL